jgi:hypothetical protein
MSRRRTGGLRTGLLTTVFYAGVGLSLATAQTKTRPRRKRGPDEDLRRAASAAGERRVVDADRQDGQPWHY